MQKQIKKIIVILCFLLFVPSCVYTAVVSDNDGSSFITKAEFDSLNNTFQSQIDEYNSSIDSKIDNAIAAYLAGVKVGSTTTKKVLLGDYKGVAMYENSSLEYAYSRPEFHCYLLGVYAAKTTSKVDSSGTAGWTKLTGFFNSKIDYDPTATTFGRELSIIKNTVASPSYIWQGYDTNVKRTITVTQLVKTVPTDSSYTTIGWTQLTMALNDAWTTATKETDINNKCLIKGAIWANNGTTIPSGNLDDFYGPLNFVTYVDSKTNNIVLDYKPETRPDYQKWQNYYVISYSNVSKPCNLRDEVKQFSPPVTGASTETQLSFHNSTTVTGTEHLDWQGTGVYHKSIGKYNLTVTSPNTYMKLNGDVPIYGGLGLIKSEDIRQKEDNIMNNEIPSVSLSDLSLVDGFPLLIEKKDTKIKYDIEFNDTTGEYYKVWLSYKPFDGEPTDTGSDNVTLSDGKKYAIISDGKGTLNWTMEDTSGVYLKWVRCDSAGTPLSTNKDNGILNLEKSNSYEMTRDDG